MVVATCGSRQARNGPDDELKGRRKSASQYSPVIKNSTANARSKGQIRPLAFGVVSQDAALTPIKADEWYPF